MSTVRLKSVHCEGFSDWALCALLDVDDEKDQCFRHATAWLID